MAGQHDAGQIVFVRDRQITVKNTFLDEDLEQGQPDIKRSASCPILKDFRQSESKGSKGSAVSVEAVAQQQPCWQKAAIGSTNSAGTPDIDLPRLFPVTDPFQMAFAEFNAWQNFVGTTTSGSCFRPGFCETGVLEEPPVSPRPVDKACHSWPGTPSQTLINAYRRQVKQQDLPVSQAQFEPERRSEDAVRDAVAQPSSFLTPRTSGSFLSGAPGSPLEKYRQQGSVSPAQASGFLTPRTSGGFLSGGTSSPLEKYRQQGLSILQAAGVSNEDLPVAEAHPRIMSPGLVSQKGQAAVDSRRPKQFRRQRSMQY